MIRKFALPLILLSLIAFTFGCGEDEETQLAVSEQQVSADLHANLQSNIDGMAESLLFLDNTVLLEDMFGLMMPTAEVSSEVPPPDGSGGGEGDELDLDMRSDADSLAQFLSEEIFSDANIESSTSTSVTYALRASELCMMEEYTWPADPMADPIIEEVLDQECADTLAEFPVRFVVTSAHDGDLDIALEIGTFSPASFAIYANELGVTVDLGETRALIVAAMEFMAEGNTAEVPEVMEGRIRAAAIRNAPQDYTLEFSILSPVSVRYTLEGETLALDMASADPAFSVRANGPAEELTMAYGFGAIDVSFPAAWTGGESESCTTDELGNWDCTYEQTGPDHGLFDLHMGGVTGSMLLNGVSEMLTLTGMGLGDSTTTFSIDGQPLVAVDLNADAGRTFDLTITSDADGVRLAVVPSFNLVVALTMQNIADQISDLDAWLLNDTFSITLDGDAAPAILANDTGLQVVAGQLTVASNDFTVDVGAGMCLVEDETVEWVEGQHPLEVLMSGACQ